VGDGLAADSVRWSGQQREGRGVPGTYDTEMPPVQRGYLNETEPFGDRDNPGVGRTERQVRVLVDQVRHPRVVVGREVDRLEVTVGQRAQEGRLDPRTASRASR